MLTKFVSEEKLRADMNVLINYLMGNSPAPSYAILVLLIACQHIIALNPKRDTAETLTGWAREVEDTVYPLTIGRPPADDAK